MSGVQDIGSTKQRTWGAFAEELFGNLVEARCVRAAGLVTQRDAEDVPPQWLIVALSGALVNPCAIPSICQLREEKMACSNIVGCMFSTQNLPS